MHTVMHVIPWAPFWMTLSLVLAVKFLAGLLGPLLVCIRDTPFELLATKLSIASHITLRHELQQALLPIKSTGKATKSSVPLLGRTSGAKALQIRMG